MAKLSLKQVFDKMTSEELNRLHEYLTSAAGIFVNALPQNSEIERMIACEEYRDFFYIRYHAFLEIARREKEEQNKD